MTTPKLHPDLSEFLCCLVDHRVRVIVLGGHVLATLGRPRFTEDLDVLVEPTRANAQRLACALEAFGYPGLAAQAAEHFSQPERMATLARPPVAIDILTTTLGLTFAEAWRGRQRLIIDGRRVAFLGLKESSAEGPRKSAPRRSREELAGDTVSAKCGKRGVSCGTTCASRTRPARCSAAQRRRPVTALVSWRNADSWARAVSSIFEADARSCFVPSACDLWLALSDETFPEMSSIAVVI